MLWWGIGLNLMPELPFQFDQSSDQRFIAFNPMDFQMLPAQQRGDIGHLFAGDGKLVMDLQLDILRTKTQ